MNETSMERAMRIIEEHPTVFRPDFAQWLGTVWEVWARFEHEALTIAKRRSHWSAQTIIEYLRHETALRDTSDPDYKLNQKWASSMARLFAMLHPYHEELFEFRVREGDGVVAMPPKMSRER